MNQLPPFNPDRRLITYIEKGRGKARDRKSPEAILVDLHGEEVRKLLGEESFALLQGWLNEIEMRHG